MRKTPRRRTCGTMAVHHRLLEQDPGFRARQMALEHATMRRMAAGAARVGVTTIPVVVHVVYNTASENISKAQIDSQIAVLNRDYRATNPDKSKVPSVWKGFVANVRVQFVLATKDPNGKPTTGVTRTKTARKSFSDDNGVKFAARGGIAWSSCVHPPRGPPGAAAVGRPGANEGLCLPRSPRSRFPWPRLEPCRRLCRRLRPGEARVRRRS